MIIRLLDDNTMPEDKVIMSVPDASKLVKPSMVVIRQKFNLTLKPEQYTLWHVANRKADKSRAPIDKEKSWAENGVADKAFIYVKERADGDESFVPTATPPTEAAAAAAPPPPPPPP